jgi:DNA-binding NtrC family response regulator
MSCQVSLLNEPLRGQEQHRAKTHQILLVDDDPNILVFVALALEDQGYHVAKVSSAESAIQTLSKRDFDLVITDLDLPGASGITVLKTAKALNPETMVMILTGNHDFEFAMESSRVVADEYLLKPCTAEELYLCVGKCLERLQEKRTREQSEARIRA